jgi:hypothetical protein
MIVDIFAVLALIMASVALIMAVVMSLRGRRGGGS